jgi:hypothetical protein
MAVKVTILVCDRCDREMRESEIEEAKLDLSLKFDDPESSSFLPMRRRERLELCPECREAFADWLGDRADRIAGLRTNGHADEATVHNVEVPAIAETTETPEA